jgi:hypothetical protein
MFSSIPSHIAPAATAGTSQSHLRTAPFPDRNVEIAKDAARRVGLHMARMALEDEALVMENTQPDIKEIILSGASYLLNEGYPYPVDVMLAKRDDPAVDGSFHFFLRVHGPDKDSSFMADPTRWMDRKKREEAPPQFEKLFNEQEAGAYALRNPGPPGGGNASGVNATSIFTVVTDNASALDRNLMQLRAAGMATDTHGTATDAELEMAVDGGAAPSPPATVASSDDRLDAVPVLPTRSTARVKGGRTAQWVAMAKMENAHRLQQVAGEDDDLDFGIPRTHDLPARPPRGKATNEKSSGAPYGLKADGQPLKAPRRDIRPRLIAAGEALETVRRLAEMALTDPEQAIAEIFMRSAPNGHLGNRIALLMSMRPNAGTAPFANFVQLVNDLCESGELDPLRALNLLAPSDGKTGGVVLLPSDVIGSHWSNEAAPVFAQTLCNISRNINASTRFDSYGPDIIVHRLGIPRSDPYAIGYLQRPRSFYQKIAKPTIRNGAAVQATRILASCGLVSAKSSTAFSYASVKHPHLPLSVELMTSRELAVRNVYQFEHTCQIDADLDERDLHLLTAVPPRPTVIREPVTAKNQLRGSGAMATALSALASSASFQSGRHYNPAERYSAPQQPQKYSGAACGIDMAGLAAWAVPIRTSRHYGSEIVSEIASRGPDDAESATRYAEHSSRRAQANFRNADDALYRATVSATATAGNISMQNAGDYVASRQEDRFFGGVDYRLFEASGSGTTPGEEPSTSRSSREPEPESRKMLLKD